MAVSPDNKTLAKRIVRAVLKDLGNRGGIDDALDACDDACDDDIKREIRRDLAKIVKGILDKAE